MTVALNSLTTTPAVQPYVPTVSGASSAALSSVATGLSAESAVVASLGGSTGVSVYTASGLLNSIQQAGTATEAVSVPADGSNVDTSGSAQQALNQGIVSTLPTSASESGIYTGAGTVQGLPSAQASANWADILKANPSLAGSVIADSYTSGIVSSLQVSA